MFSLPSVFCFFVFFLSPGEHASSAAVNVPPWQTGIVKTQQKQLTMSIC